MCIAHHGSDDAFDEIQITKAARSTIALHDFLDRTSEVDVDEVWTKEIRYQGRGFAHGLGIGPEDLDSDGPFVLAEPEVFTGLPIPLHDPIGAHELCRYHVSTKPSAKPAEWSFAHTRLRREEEWRSSAGEQLEDINRHAEKGRVQQNTGEGEEGRWPPFIPLTVLRTPKILDGRSHPT